MFTILLRLIREDDGQDVIEYALLTAGIGVVSAATWPLIAAGVGTVYKRYNANTQAAWEIPNPGSN